MLRLIRRPAAGTTAILIVRSSVCEHAGHGLEPDVHQVDAVPAWNGSPARDRIGRYADREQGPEAGQVVYLDIEDGLVRPSILQLA